jgi:hypothetical protein
MFPETLKETYIMRSVIYDLLLGFSIATANAQTAPPLALGTYTAGVHENRKASGVDLVIKHITTDGRITGTVREHRAGPMCGMPLPANGLILKNGEVRVEVNAGAPEGCEHTYFLGRMANGSLKGEMVRAGKRYPIQFARR